MKLKGNDGTVYEYLHMHPNSITVTEGSKVKQGDVVGRVSKYMGGTRSTTYHLHFNVRQRIQVGNKVLEVYVPPYTSLIAAYRRSKGIDSGIDAMGDLAPDPMLEIGAVAQAPPQPAPTPSDPQPTPAPTPPAPAPVRSRTDASNAARASPGARRAYPVACSHRASARAPSAAKSGSAVATASLRARAAATPGPNSRAAGSRAGSDPAAVRSRADTASSHAAGPDTGATTSGTDPAPGA